MSQIYKKEQIEKVCRQALEDLLAVAKLEKADILVVGCSTSEVQEKLIGSHSSEDIGSWIFSSLQELLRPRGIYLAAQCCEHLNRALVIEGEAARLYAYPRVNAVPKINAGGSFATAAYRGFDDPYVVERIEAAAGIDIGHTLIGMHLRPVAVPVRASIDRIGSAHLVLARTRPKSIGGERTSYDERLG